jgi:hypothetical protein
LVRVPQVPQGERLAHRQTYPLADTRLLSDVLEGGPSVKLVCGARRTGATGIQWLCIKKPHGAEHTERDAKFIEYTSNGTAWPESMKHYMIAVEPDGAGGWRRAREQTGVSSR